MTDTVGTTTRLLHLLVLLAVAVPGIGVLLFLAVRVMDPQSMAMLALFFAAPLWIAGLFAGAELIRLARGGSLTFRRAQIWAIGVLLVGVVLGYFTGFLSAGVHNLARLDAVAWLVVILVALGASSLLSIAVDRRRAAAPVG
ncbi:hypothetical protein BH23CHL7_BH23CHL7_04810 [soil metagenome]